MYKANRSYDLMALYKSIVVFVVIIIIIIIQHSSNWVYIKL